LTPSALSEDLVLVQLLLLEVLVALTTLFRDLATLSPEEPIQLILSGAPLLLPKVICLSFLSLGEKTLLFEKRLLFAYLILFQEPLFLGALLLQQVLPA
jgi:hypothetical protein